MTDALEETFGRQYGRQRLPQAIHVSVASAKDRHGLALREIVEAPLNKRDYVVPQTAAAILDLPFAGRSILPRA